VIGSLTLMITALALTGMNTGPAGGREESEVRRAEEYMVLQREIEECQAKIDALSKATGEQGKLAKLLAEAQKQRERLETTSRQRTEQLKLESELKAKIAAQQKSAADLTSRKDELEKRRATLRQELDTRQRMLTESVVKVLPPSHGRPVKYTPYFVEARNEGLVLNHGAKPHAVATGAIGKDKALNDLLAHLSGKSTHQLVLLLRDDGHPSRNRLLPLADRSNVTVGQIPLVGDGRLDLTGVKKP